MMLWDALVWLIIARVAVMLFEDAAFAARDKRSPRMKERARRREAERKAEEAGDAPPGRWGRVKAAAADYVTGLVEDGARAARAHRRRRRARKRGRQAVDGVLVDVDDHDEHWYADCDVCGWSSRPFVVEANAKLAGAEHARSHRDDEADGDGDVPPATRPRFTVIPGGADNPAAPQPAGSASTVLHPCDPADPDPTTDPAGAAPADTDPAGGEPAAGVDTTTEEMTVNLEATGPDEIRAAFSTAIETANDRAEEVSGVAAVLSEAADRYESLEMAASTVAHIRDAADQFHAAQGSLQSAAEELEAALADFNARDGQVAEAVDDAGNLASREVLVS